MDTTVEVTAFIYDELLNAPPGLELSPETPLLMDGLVSSIAAMRLVAFLEERYRIEVPPEDVTLEHFATIAAICHYVERRRV